MEFLRVVARERNLRTKRRERNLRVKHIGREEITNEIYRERGIYERNTKREKHRKEREVLARET